MELLLTRQLRERSLRKVKTAWRRLGFSWVLPVERGWQGIQKLLTHDPAIRRFCQVRGRRGDLNLYTNPNIRGLSNSDMRASLEDCPHLRDLVLNPKKQSAKVSRILNRFHAHKLIAKIPGTQRWRVTDHGKQIIDAYCV